MLYEQTTLSTTYNLFVMKWTAEDVIHPEHLCCDGATTQREAHRSQPETQLQNDMHQQPYIVVYHVSYNKEISQ